MAVSSEHEDYVLVQTVSTMFFCTHASLVFFCVAQSQEANALVTSAYLSTAMQEGEETKMPDMPDSDKTIY